MSNGQWTQEDKDREGWRLIGQTFFIFLAAGASHSVVSESGGQDIQLTILFGLGLVACLAYLLYHFRKNNFSYKAYSKNIHIVTIAMVLFGAFIGGHSRLSNSFPPSIHTAVFCSNSYRSDEGDSKIKKIKNPDWIKFVRGG